MSLPSTIKAAYGWLVGRQGNGSLQRSYDSSDLMWSGGWGSQSATGITITQSTAMACSTVMACVRMLSSDLAKAIPGIFREEDGKRTEAKGHFLHDLLIDPNDWQTWPEFCAQMQMGLVLRGNAYAVIVRDQRSNPVYFVPINPDFCHLWESPDGSLFYMVTRSGLHQMAVLQHEPMLIPARDVLHLKGPLSSNGLTGLSPIALNREAIALSLAQEQQAARWMGNGAKPSGILTTDKLLTQDAYDRAKASWQAAQAGLANSGKTAMLEMGLKWQPLSMTSQDIEFIASRRYQDEEIARMFRIPIPMVTEVESSAKTDPDVLAQHYVNYTISDYTSIWSSRFSKVFGLRAQNLRLGFDLSVLLQSDLAARINMHRNAVMGGLETQNEGRAGIGLGPMDGADLLLTPSNSTPFGSDKSGTAPNGAGRPEKNGDGNPDQPGAN